MFHWSRIANVFRSRQLDRDIDEELQSHLEEAHAKGRRPDEAVRAFGSRLRAREAVRDAVMARWLESILSDIRYGWRQLLKHRTTTLAAVLSLALGIGSCTAAFRLMDAVLFRPLPVTEPERLRVLGVSYTNEFGQTDIGYSGAYATFQRLRAAVTDRAELIAIDAPDRIDLTYSTDEEMERAYRQYVSGWTFSVFGLKPAAGRLFTEEDDVHPGAHPYAVISYSYWTRRFGRNPAVMGRTLRAGNHVLRIIGVAPEGFTGTESGVITDLFVPTMMNVDAIPNPNWNWFRTWVQLKPGAAAEPLRQQLKAALAAYRQEQVKTLPPGVPQRRINDFLNSSVVLEPATAGISELQRTYRRSLAALGIVALLVLLIACANVANLMTAQAASRAREMALRVSIGAGRTRLLQLLLIEAGLVALLSSLLGIIFAWRAAPLVVGMINPPDHPVQLIMRADWRVTTFAVLLTIGVTLLFGLTPALRASAVKPADALKGGARISRRRWMNTAVAVQAAFCLLVTLTAALFRTTFERLANQPKGFSADRVLVLDTVAKTGQPGHAWYRVAGHLRSVPGVESASVAGWALMSGTGWNGSVWANGLGPEDRSEPWFLGVSPGWLETMKIPLLEGRDLRADDAQPSVAVVNEAFARSYFGGRSPVGRAFERLQFGKRRVTVRIVGLAGDARYASMRQPIPATAYFPFQSLAEDGKLQAESSATLIVRTKSANPLELASALRKEVPRSGSAFRVANIRTQQELVEMHTLRERLLATLSLFFAVVALVLSGVGLYGVLNYAVVERRRELGIRIALGAGIGDVAGQVSLGVFGMIAAGVMIGLGLGLASERYIAALLFEVRATDPSVLAVPMLTMLGAAALVSFSPVIRALRIDPAVLLRSE